MLTAYCEPVFFFLRCIIMRKTSKEHNFFAHAQLGQRGWQISGFLRVSSVFLDSFPGAVLRGNILTNQMIRSRIVRPISGNPDIQNLTATAKLADILSIRGRFPHQTRSLTKNDRGDLESTRT